MKCTIRLEELVSTIKEFYDPKIWHFVGVNAIDNQEQTCTLQWIFCKYQSKSTYHIFECEVSYGSVVDSITPIIPNALMSEREIVDLFGLRFTNISPGLYLDETSQKTPLKGVKNG